jgi:hypothetical protein
MVPLVVTGLNPAKIVAPFTVVSAAQCAAPPLAPQGGCGLTLLPTVAMGLKSTNTVGSPVKIIPPPALASPTRCTNFGTIYPIKILFLTGLIPVVASR